MSGVVVVENPPYLPNRLHNGPPRTLRDVHDRHERHAYITAIDAATPFPESLNVLSSRYREDIDVFCGLVAASSSSFELLEVIRSNRFVGKRRGALLKIFRRAVSSVVDTERSKKVSTESTEEIIRYYGHTFKDIKLLKQQFLALTKDKKAALAALIGEYDERGKAGYILTGMFFDWFEAKFKDVMEIEGPRGAGPDVELSRVLTKYEDKFPCDFVIRRTDSQEALAVGFARYDATRGGGQSDDRTGGNALKVMQARKYCEENGDRLRILFLADGPGLAHADTWEAAVKLDGEWHDNVRVTTMKLAASRVTKEWLLNAASE